MIDIGLDFQRFILVFFRVVSMIWLLPLFESKSISTVYKAALSLLIAFLLFKTVPVPNIGGDAFLLLIAIGKEMLIGLSVGFMVRIIFAMVSAAGEVISTQSGMSFARTLDPTMNVQTSVIEQMKNLLAIMIFLAIDGHHIVLKGISTSLKQVPPGMVTMRPGLFEYMIDATGKLFGAALKIGAPVIVTLFLVELALGVLARLVPQVNVFIEGASIKILITLTVLALSLNLIVPVIATAFRGMDGEMLKIMRLMS